MAPECWVRTSSRRPGGRGHDVTVVSTREGAGDVVATIEETDAVLRIAQGVDAVVVSVPPARATSADAWLEAMRALAASPLEARLVMVGGAGSTLDADGNRLLDGPDFPEEIKPEATATNAALDMFREGPVTPSWTIISPAPVLAPGERTGAYRTSDDTVMGLNVSTQDFAAAMVDELENPQHLNARFVVSN